MRRSFLKFHKYDKVNNKALYHDMLNRENTSIITETMSKAFVNIGVGLSHKKNFHGYSYLDEMILDGIEQCVKYQNRFKPEKSKNPFSYFTQIMYRAFLRRIEKEKRQLHVKFENTQSLLDSDHTVDIPEEYKFMYEKWKQNKVIAGNDYVPANPKIRDESGRLIKFINLEKKF